MNQFKILGFLTLTLAFVACGQSSPKESKTEEVTTAPENWKIYSETEYSIQYPDTFELAKSGQMGTSFILLSNLTSQQDLFRENVNLIRVC